MTAAICAWRLSQPGREAPASPDDPDQEHKRDGRAQGREHEVVGPVDPRIHPERMQVEINLILEVPLDGSTGIMREVMPNRKVVPRHTPRPERKPR